MSLGDLAKLLIDTELHPVVFSDHICTFNIGMLPFINVKYHVDMYTHHMK